MREIVVNLKDTILKYAAAKNHTHGNEYINRSELEAHEQKNAQTQLGHTQLANNITSTQNNPVAGKTIASYITTTLNDYYTKAQINNLFDNYYNKSTIDSKISAINTALGRITTDWSGHSITNPKQTTTKIDHLVDRGYYQYKGTHATFSCSPDAIAYTNGLIQVEKQSNHIIQHVYATSYSSSAQTYKIDGRIFVRHGYTLTNNGTTTYHWEKWYVEHIPYRERKDLVGDLGRNVHNGSFKIYEITGGYIFKWKQGGNNDGYTLPMAKYTYEPICKFKKDLPIPDGYTIGILMGHVDVRINSSAFNMRATNGKGEVIGGIDISYFVPRTN